MATVAGATLPAYACLAISQQETHRIGFLGTANEKGYASLLESFRQGLRKAGWEEGKNVRIDYAWANGDYSQLEALALRIISARPDVLVTHGTPGTIALQKATREIPIVMAVSGEAEASGLIKSFSHPGGNTTGQSFLAADMSVKRVEIILEAAPQIKRIATLSNVSNPFAKIDLKAFEQAASERGIDSKSYVVNGSNDFERAFLQISSEGNEAVSIIHDAVLTASVKKLADICLEYRLYSTGEGSFVKAGGLIGYGPDLNEMWRNAATFVDKILKGAHPADLPVQLPTKFETVLNLKTARALGVVFPSSLLARSDDLLE